MLLMLGSLRAKAFPKVMAIIDVVIKSPFGNIHHDEIVEYLESYLRELSLDEERNKYLIMWISYFFVSNGLKGAMTFKPNFMDLITERCSTVVVRSLKIVRNSRSFPAVGLWAER